MINILEQEDLIKGLPDQALMQEAQRPSGELPQFLVVSEIQRRSDMRKRYKAEQEQMPQATVKEQVVQEGIMGAMPPQMAMVPQMPQRMPQMPPQGIQQAMPPQRMAGGGVVRLFGGGGTGPEAIIRNVLAQNPNATMVDFLEAGITEEQAKAYYHLINPGVLDRARSKAPFGRPASEIYQGAGFDTDIQMFDPAKIPPGEGSSNVYAGADGFMGLGAIPRAISNMFTPDQTAPVDTAALDLADTQLDRMDQNEYLRSLITDRERRINQLDVAEQRGEPIRIPLTPEEIEMTNRDFADIARMQRPFKDRFAEFADDKLDALRLGASAAYDLAGSGIDSLTNSSYGRMIATLPDSISGLFSSPDKDVSGIIAADPSSAALDVDQQNVGSSVAPAQQQDLSNVLIDDQAQANLGLVPNDSQISKYLNLGPDGAVRAGGDDAMLPSGPERASGALEELKDLINKQSKSMSSTNRGAALVALGTGILEGKTAEGGRAAAKILSDDAKAQGALQMEGAKIAAADERERNRLAVMREDLENKLGISQNASNRTALAEVTRALAEYDGFAVRGIADKLAKGLPLTPDEKMYMTLQQAQQMLIPIVAPATKGLFANTGTQQPPPAGGGAVDPSQFDNSRT